MLAAPPIPASSETTLQSVGPNVALLSNALLRKAITCNLVTFPSQIQPFVKRFSVDIQTRIVLLYFVRGWTVRNICVRYALSKAMTHKILAEWRSRAVESGHIQEIQAGSLQVLLTETQDLPGQAEVSRVSNTAEVFEENVTSPIPEIEPFSVSFSVARPPSAIAAGGLR